MFIVITKGKGWEGFETQSMKIDGQRKLNVHPLCECSEDAIIERDLVSCEQVADFMKEAYDAALRGEEFNVFIEHEEEE
jgi:hypothetical protein